MKESLLQLTQQLVAFQSIQEKPEELKRAVDFVEQWFADDQNVFIKRYEENGSHSIVVSNTDTIQPDILMLAHLDVVPASEDFFSVQQDENILRGRGVADDKGPAAVCLQAMKTVLSMEQVPSVALILTTDEEIGGQNGARYLIDTIGYRASVALVPDGGTGPSEIIIRNKGFFNIKITVAGETAHGSRPWEGKNAIYILMEVIERIRNRFPIQDVDQDWYTTANVSLIGGGTAQNQTPASAWCSVDIRYIEDTSPEQLLKDLESILPDECSFEVLSQAPCAVTNQDNSYVQLYVQALQTVTGAKPNFAYSGGANDGRYLVAHDIPVIIARPVSGKLHAPNEWTEWQSVEDLYNIYIHFIQSFK